MRSILISFMVLGRLLYSEAIISEGIHSGYTLTPTISPNLALLGNFAYHIARVVRVNL